MKKLLFITLKWSSVFVGVVMVVAFIAAVKDYDSADASKLDMSRAVVDTTRDTDKKPYDIKPEPQKRTTTTAKSTSRSLKSNDPLNSTISEMLKILSTLEVDGLIVSGKETEGGRAIITIIWPGFNRLQISDQKDMLNSLMTIPLALYEGGGHEITIRNQVRRVAKVTHSSWSGVETEFY